VEMNITEYKLTISYDNDTFKEIVYRGNENIIISTEDWIDDYEIVEKNRMDIRFPRHILEKFLEMINET
jgi:hypothetical protein